MRSAILLLKMEKSWSKEIIECALSTQVVFDSCSETVEEGIGEI